jgi:DNA repair exonuclease SbcCD ATPase subunit
MKMKQTGFFWHVHHHILLEWCHSFKEREEYIRTHKEHHEIKRRLNLFKPVKGALPEEVVKAGQAYAETWRAVAKAEQAYDKARRAYAKAERAYAKARQAYDKAWRAVDKAGQAYNKALENNKSFIEALHAKECPDCPWNGQTIFSEYA